MDLFSVTIVVLLCAMSAVIGYFGDIIGRKVGKKRLSFGGLRPKHTAAIGTAFAGVMISILSIAALMTISAPVREWILKGPKIAQDFERKLGELRDATASVKNLENQAKSAEAANRKLTADIGRAEVDLNAKQSKLAEANGRLKGLESRISTLQPRIRALTGTVQSSAAKISALNASELKARNELASVQFQQRVAKQSLKALGVTVSETSQRNLVLQNLTDDLSKEKARLEKELAQIRADTENFKTQRDQAKVELDTSQNELQAAKTQLDAAKAELATTRAELSQSATAEYQLYAISKNSRNEPMIYRIGEEVCRQSVRAGLNVHDARSELTTFLRRARIEAEKRGAREKGEYQAAGIFPHTDSITKETISSSMIEDEKIMQIAGAKEERVIIATSSLNAFKGEPVSLEVVVQPNPVVYSAGQVVAEGLIDANRDSKSIVDEVTLFIQKDVKGRAIKDGMIAIANSDISFGQITLPQIIELTTTLKKANRRIRLQAVASSKTLAADTLKLEFRLR